MKLLFLAPLFASLSFAAIANAADESSDSTALMFRLKQAGVYTYDVANGSELRANTIVCNSAPDARLTRTCAINFDGDKQTKIHGDEAAKLEQLLLRSLGAAGPSVSPEHILASDVVCTSNVHDNTPAHCALLMIRPTAAAGERLAVGSSGRK